MKVRSLLTRPRASFKTFCISVGNIACGGRGKSPMCAYLARLFSGLGAHPVILTRGYKARPPKYPYLLSINDSPRLCGDEPLEMAQAIPEAEIIVDPDRNRAAAWAEKYLKPDVFLLDDGFQNLKTRRDFNLVLLSAEDLGDGWNRVLPSGTWREGKKALRRADMLAVNPGRHSPPDIAELAEKRLAGLGKPVIYFYSRAKQLRSAQGQERREAKGDYLLIAGIANPENFVHTACAFLGRPPKTKLFFPDHHYYTDKDWKHIRSLADKKQCAHIICTRKDEYKLGHLADETLLVLDMEIHFPARDKSILLTALQCAQPGAADPRVPLY